MGLESKVEEGEWVCGGAALSVLPEVLAAYRGRVSSGLVIKNPDRGIHVSVNN